MVFEGSTGDFGNSEWKEHKGSFSGSREVLFLDLGSGYTDGSLLNILLSCTLMISAFSVCMLYFNKKLTKTGYVPQFEFPDPRLSCPFSLMSDVMTF